MIPKQLCIGSACSFPVAGWGVYSLVFNPKTQLPTALNLRSSRYDTWKDFTIELYIYITRPDSLSSPERPILFKGTRAISFYPSLLVI